MRKYIVFFILFWQGIAIGQKKYVIVYDKLKDSVCYKEMVYQYGKETPKDLYKKPKVKNGDLVIVRAQNVNEFVFDMQVDQIQETTNENSNPVETLIQGFSGVLMEGPSALSGVISQLGGFLNSPPPRFQPNGRGGTSLSIQQQEYINNVYKKIELTRNKLSESQYSLESLKNGLNLLKADTLPLKEMRREFSKFKEQFQMEMLVNNLDTIHEITTEVNSLAESNDSLPKEVVKECKKLQKFIHDFDQELIQHFDTTSGETEGEVSEAINADLLDICYAKLEEATFEKEQSFIVADIGNSSQEQAAYMMKFQYLNDSPEGNYSDNIQIVRKVELEADYPHLPIWTTGINIVRPFNGTQDYNFKEFSEMGDSMMIVSNSYESFIFSVGTSIAYEFKTNKAIIPNVNAGMSIGILERDDKPISFVLGGGIRFKSIPFFSLSAGISFTENTKLRDGFTSDNWMLTPGNFTEEQSITKTTFSPGYFFGLSIHF
jgi:hypothetical protein